MNKRGAVRPKGANTQRSLEKITGGFSEAGAMESVSEKGVWERQGPLMNRTLSIALSKEEKVKMVTFPEMEAEGSSSIWVHLFTVITIHPGGDRTIGPLRHQAHLVQSLEGGWGSTGSPALRRCGRWRGSQQPRPLAWGVQ